jgi:muconolactone D-isomerase
MLFHVRMDVRIPHDLDPATRADLVAQEKERALEIQRSGAWPQLWRIAGEYANISVFDVGSNDELHELLSSLPLFPFMTIAVTPLAAHPSKLGS